MHLALRASQFRKFGLGVDYPSAQATGADGEKRKSAKTWLCIFNYVLIWGRGVEIPEQVAPVASEKPMSHPVAEQPL